MQVCAQKQTPKKVSVHAVMSGEGITPVAIITEDLFKRILEATACIREKIGRIPHVRKIAYSTKGQLITLWTFVGSNDQTTLRSIYKAEEEIMDIFKDLRFDFTVIFDHKSEAPKNFITELCLQ